MCTHVFLGSDIEVPTSKWSLQDHRFHVEKVDEETMPVRRHFSKPHIYYLAAHEGCGCGFEWDSREQSKELEVWEKE